jgi:hypothetical protein
MPAENFAPKAPPVPLSAIIAGVAVLFGIGVFSFGFWLAWHPLGFIMGGLSVSTLGILLGRKRPARRQA